MELLALALVVLCSPLVLSLAAAVLARRRAVWGARPRRALRRRLASARGGVALECLVGFVTAPSTTPTALTMSSGDSLTVRNGDMSKAVRLLNAWTLQQTAGTLRIRSPKMHDGVQGVRLRSTAANAQPLLPLGVGQRVWPNDTLTVDLTGSATAGDIEQAALLMYYDDLPGQAARFIDRDQLNSRMVHYFSTQNTLSTGTAGGWSGEEAINAEDDQFKANTDYAILGFVTDTAAAAIGWKGADLGNLRVGGPGNPTFKELTSRWFVLLSDVFGKPMIPVINSNNKGGVQIAAAVDENGSDPIVHTIFAELTSTGGR